MNQCLGFDSATKVFSSIIGNLGAHACTTRRTWYFIRVPGRYASHIAVECSLRCRPNLVVLSEEVAAKHLNLADLTKALCDMIELRSEKGHNHGVVLIPDGLLSNIPEMRQLIEEVNAAHRSGRLSPEVQESKKYSKENPLNETTNLQCENASWDLLKYLSPLSQGVFSNLPDAIQYQIRTFVSPSTEMFKFKHVDVTNLEGETLLKGLVESELSRRKGVGQFRGGGFQCQAYSLSFQTRSAMPTNFDCDLGYTLGHGAAALAEAGRTALMVHVENLHLPDPANWIVGGLPLTSLLTIRETNIGIKRTENMARRYSVQVKPSVPYFSTHTGGLNPNNLDNPPVNPGPVQFAGPLSKRVCHILEGSQFQGNAERIQDIEGLCKELKLLASARLSNSALDSVCASLQAALQIVKTI